MADLPVLSTTPTDGTLRYDEDVLIGYRGLAAPGEPLFPFGHGLGYTTWAYESLTIEDGGRGGHGPQHGRAARSRGGPGVRGPDHRAAARCGPARWLAGFAGVTAAPGESVTVRIPLPERTFQVWDDGGWRTVPGAYRVEASAAVTDPKLTATVDV